MRSDVVNLKVTSVDGRDVLNMSNVFVVPKIPVNNSNVNCEIYSHLSDLKISQDVRYVDLLIGQDNSEALIPVRIRKGQQGEPFAVQTLFGWSLNGPCKLECAKSTIVNHFISTSVLEQKVEKFWQLENEGLVKDDVGWSQSDKEVVKLWDDNIEMVDNHYILPIPWKEDAYVPNNVTMATSRLQSLRNSLVKKNLFKRYNDEIQKLIDKSYAELADPYITESNAWYLPHHPVITEKKPGKLRIVFDCAAKYQGESLNEKCKRGPDLNNKLSPVLLRF